MPDPLTNGPHLPEISIRNFRGVKRLSINRLGRVTLLAGRNGAGKTTVLEAVRVYASRAHPKGLIELLEKREDVLLEPDGDRASAPMPDIAALFYGRTLTHERRIKIGPKSGTEVLSLEVLGPTDWPERQTELFADLAQDGDLQAIRVVFQGKQRFLPWLADSDASSVYSWRQPYGRFRGQRLFGNGKWRTVKCRALGPGLPDNTMLTRIWERVALTDAENLALKALRLAFDGIERIAVVGVQRSGFKGRKPYFKVKLRGNPHPLPLKSLGDGAARLFAAGLALSSCDGGFLVLDEAENGIHYSVQPAFWKMVLRAARQHNVQVVATTHSSDCVKGFAYAADEVNDARGVLVRLDRDGDHVRAVEYTEEDTIIAGKQGIEVR